jgi:glucose/arabinose dehydrogenase
MTTTRHHGTRTASPLRNPWRFDIDPRRQVIFISDVGEHAFEEINVIDLDKPGRNFGWAVREGDQCFQGRSTECTSKGFVVRHRRGRRALRHLG